MVELSLQCAIVGQVGSSFGVKIDDGAKVSDLKDAIKSQSDGIITRPWPLLELFLAKTEGGAWLDEAGVAAVALDERGRPMDPTLWIKNPKYFGENFRPGEGQVHVLVVVPEGAGGSALLQQVNTVVRQDIVWYGMQGSVGRTNE
ncbi:Crinkler (CRN) [Phytophthora megakarya]|uniref:Crinkler (CRN) n=1 Tax=Phytophthora megakarya TaxID=4795 RepID=A0A225UIG2_9STRA|nr:Crinkler (CRN) [Phytophthora megakarya]